MDVPQVLKKILSTQITKLIYGHHVQIALYDTIYVFTVNSKINIEILHILQN